MKKLLIAMAALACATLVPVSKAQANCPGQVRYISNCGFCGGPFYQRWEVIDLRRGVEYGWALLPHTCNPGAYNRGHSTHHHHASHRKHSSHRHGSHHHSSRRKKDKCRR